MSECQLGRGGGGEVASVGGLGERIRLAGIPRWPIMSIQIVLHWNPFGARSHFLLSCLPPPHLVNFNFFSDPYSFSLTSSFGQVLGTLGGVVRIPFVVVVSFLPKGGRTKSQASRPITTPEALQTIRYII